LEREGVWECVVSSWKEIRVETLKEKLEEELLVVLA
jgi:hypothetical protein